MKDSVLTKALVIEPKKDIYFKEINITKSNDSDVLVKWVVSSVCNSERRRRFCQI